MNFKTRVIYTNHIIPLPAPPILPTSPGTQLFFLLYSLKKKQQQKPKRANRTKIIKQINLPTTQNPGTHKMGLFCVKQFLLGLSQSVVDMHNDTLL